MTKRYLLIAALLLLTLSASPVLLKAAERLSAKPAASPSPPSSPKLSAREEARSNSRTPKPKPSASPKPSQPTTPPASIGSTLPADQPAPPAGATQSAVRASGLEEATPSPTPYLTAGDLGPLGWFADPILFGVVAFLILLALGLHLVHVLRLGSLNRSFDQLAANQRLMGNAARVIAPPGRNAEVDKLAEQLTQHGRSLTDFATRFKEIEHRFTINDGHLRDAVHAVMLTANWIGQVQLREAFAADGGNISEGARAATAAMLERYQEPLRLNSSRVEPVAQGLAESVERLNGRANSCPELMARLQSLSEEIGRFGLWHKEVSDELTSLRRGSFAQRSAGLQVEQDRLFEQVNSGSLPMTQMIKKSRALLDHYFPETPTKSAAQGQPLAEREANLKKLVSEVPDYLMNWYDTLFQLQSQIGGSAQRSAVETETASDLSRIQQIARDALGKFDIQPEAIQIGQTSYDRRLHEAALVRHAPQFPVNTVIEVHKCGFRKMSSGEVLRMPQVVVAGAAAS